ncbi:AI-2E family transporter [Schnuerera sp. xch1]|uniref:AI-2E family transporter n=1 Tax=Schnuerera sp. xch1 TaxID=2874283 RepID=UPI001CBEFAD0|nr:AI-2E family transporter [Schnuerera sp. xch1]
MNLESSVLIRNLIILISILLILIIYYLIHIGNKYVENSKQIHITKKRVLPILIIIVSVYFFYLLSQRYEILSDTLFVIVISAILAYIFNPVINYFEKYNIPRGLGILFLYILIIGIILVILISFIPRIGIELRGLLANLPIYFEQIINTFNDIYTTFINMGNIPPIFQGIEELLPEGISSLQDIVVNNIRKLFDGVGEVVNKVVSLILIPILTFYFLRDKDEFVRRLYLTIPKRRRQDVKELLLEIDRSLSQFIRGRLILAFYVGIVTTIFLLVLDIEFAILIGLVTGIADIIPYFGPLLGFLPAIIFGFLNSTMKGIWVAIIFILIQWVENNVLAPKIIGDSTGIHPITVLLSLIIGGGMFGVMGMVLSIPVVAVLKIILGHFLDRIRKRKLIK